MSTAAMAAETNSGDESFVDDVETGGQQQAEPQAAALAAKPDELKAAMAELATTVKGLATPKAETKPPTQDEINEYWSVYDPEKKNPEFFKKWMRLQADLDPQEMQTTITERKALFAQMQEGLVRQAVVGSQRLFQQELQKLREEFAPINEHVAQQRAEQTRGRFYDAYPALATKTAEGKQQFQKILDATARQLADKQFDSEESYFKALAESAAGAIKDVVPDFDLGKSVTKPAVTSPRLPRTSVGGTGGSANGGQAPKKVTADDSADIFADA